MGTMCFDIRRVDDNNVCIFRMAHNHFAYSCHRADSSWHEIDPEDKNDKYRYQYVLIAKDKDYEGIEVIVFTCGNKKHAIDTYNGCCDGSGIFYSENLYEYRLVRIPLYTYYNYTLNGKRTYKIGDQTYKYQGQKETMLHSSYKLYCPITLNRKYRVYGTYSDKKKLKGGCYWKGPERLR